jgi:uncharacterized protein YhjY with autotransporter beta-barrel domain
MKYAAAVAMGSRAVRALARGFARSCAHAMMLTLTMVATSAAHAQSISVVGAATFDNPFPSPTGALTVQAVAGQTPLPPNVVWTLLSGPAPVTLASTPLSPSGQATLASFTPTTSQGVRLSACLQGGTTCAFFRLVGCWNGSASYNGGLAGTINTTQSSDYGITLYDTLTVGNVSGAGDLPRSGVVTTWSVGAGSGSITPITSVSDANGVARTRHTLGPAIGTQTVTATFSGSRVCASGSNSIRLDVTATAPTNAPPTATFALPATGASIAAGSTLPIRITARDTDGSIARVVLSITSSTETTIAPFPVTLSTATTGADGYDYSWTNVPAGTYTLTAIAYDNNDFPSLTATRTITINPPACTPATFVQLSGSGQSALIGTTLLDDYVVRLSGAAIPAGGPAPAPATVVFTANDGSVSVTNIAIGANGEARTRHTLGATAGRQTVGASVSGGGFCPVAPVIFSATATLPVPTDPTLTLVLPDADVEIDFGKPIQLRAKINNPRGSIRSVRATITDVVTSAALPGVPLTLVSNGQYEATWTPATAGRYRVIVTATDSLAGELVSRARLITVKPPVRNVANIVIESKSTLQAKPGVPITVKVTATDAQGGIPDQVLRWTATRMTPSAAGTKNALAGGERKADCVEPNPLSDSVTTQANGVASITFTPCSADDYQFAVVALRDGGSTGVGENAVIKGVKSTTVALATSLVRLAGKSVVVLPNKPFDVTVNTVDAANAPLPDVPLSWELLPPTSGTVTPPNNQTTATGDAKALVTLAPNAKSTFLKICVVGTSNCVSFVLKNAITEVAEPAAAIAAPVSNSAVASSRLQVGQIHTRFQQLRNEQSGGFSNGVGVSTDGLRVPLPTGESKPGSSEGSSTSASGPATGAGSTERDVTADGIKGSRWGMFTLGDIDISRVGGGVGGAGPGGQKSKAAGTDSGGGYDVSTQGLTVGVDYRLRPSVVIGAALGGLRGKVEAAANSQQRATGLSGSLFAQWFAPGQFYVNAVANYGKNSYDLTRYSTDALRIDSSTNSTQQAFQLEGGYNYTNGNLSASPYLRVEHVRAAINGINESGNPEAIATTPSKLRANTYAFGLQADSKFSTSSGVWIPGVRVEYLREKQTQSNSFARLVSGVPLVNNGEITTVQVPVAPFDSSYGNIGLSLQWLTGLGAQPISVFFGFDTTFGQSGVSTKRYSAGVKVPL